MDKATLAFIGGGNMAASLVAGLVNDGYDPRIIWVSDPDGDKLQALTQTYNVHGVMDNSIACQQADIVVLAIKPQMMQPVLTEIADSIQQTKPLIISIAAGMSTDFISQQLSTEVAIVRCMPNTPALLGCAATGMVANALTTRAQKSQAESILRAVGSTVWLNKESDIDIVTALSGSGPAYFFYLMQAMEHAAIDLGLEEQTAQLLTRQTALGAAKMAMQSEYGLQSLIDGVTSPGGTTEAALQRLAEQKVETAIANAIEQAHKRAKELGGS